MTRPTPICLVVLAALLPTGASAQEGENDDARWFVEPQLHSTFLSALFDKEPLQLSYGVALRVARRNSNFGGYMNVSTTWWGSPELDYGSEDVFDGTPQGIVTLALGLEHPYFGGQMRFMVDAGITFMLRETTLDTRGRAGLEANFRPTGIRIPLAAGRTFIVDPLTFSLLIPDMTGIPLVLFQFRTVVSVEFGVGGRS